ncbi:hypothetical protein ACIQWN_32365 [Streptomyces vinaceus]|uniref:hypothetical protein n=1 Tax=Streptomyces vinaceus TaxID=1960 RepID=UPI0037F4DD64
MTVQSGSGDLFGVTTDFGMPNFLEYQKESIKINGTAMTDAADTDAARFIPEQGSFRAKLGTDLAGYPSFMGPNETSVLTFRAKAAASLTEPTTLELPWFFTDANEGRPQRWDANPPQLVPARASLKTTGAFSGGLASQAPFSLGLTTHNDGPETAEGVKLTGQLPPELTDAKAQLMGPSGEKTPCTVNAGAVSCDVGDLPSGKDATATVTGNVKPATVGRTLEVTGASTSTTPGSDPADLNTTFGGKVEAKQIAPSLEVRVDGERKKAVHEGDVLDIEVRVTNGPNAKHMLDTVQGTQKIPAGLEYVRNSLRVNDKPTSDAVGNSDAHWHEGRQEIATLFTTPGNENNPELREKIVPNSTSTLKYKAKVTGPLSAPMSFKHEFYHWQDNAQLFVRETTPAQIVPASADLKTTGAFVGDLAGGSAFTLGLKAVNEGPQTAKAVELGGKLPEELTEVEAQLTGPDGTVKPCAVAGGAVSCDVGDLPVGQNATATATGKVADAAAGKTLNVTATSTSGTPGNDPADRTAEITGTVAAPEPEDPKDPDTPEAPKDPEDGDGDKDAPGDGGDNSGGSDSDDSGSDGTPLGGDLASTGADIAWLAAGGGGILAAGAACVYFARRRLRRPTDER